MLGIGLTPGPFPSEYAMHLDIYAAITDQSIQYRMRNDMVTLLAFSWLHDYDVDG